CAPSRRPHREPAADEGPSGDHRHASRHDLCPRARGDRGHNLHAPRLRGARERQRLRRRQHRDDLRPAGHAARARASAGGQRLAREGIAQIVSSDYARAMMTAEHLQRATGVLLAIEPLLRERNFGDLRGTPYAELGFDMFALEYAPPNGETWPMFHERVDRAWERVQELAASTTRGSLAVVTHGLVCRSLAARHLILGADDAVPERWEN